MPPKIPPGSLCQKCQRRPPKKGRSRCIACNKWGIAWTRQVRAKRVAAGLCGSCGGTRVVGRKSCQRCIDRARNSWPRGRDLHRIRRYNLMPEEYERLLIEQGGKCKICGDEMIEPYVDHDHQTLKVRGLLCIKCNAVLGMARDDVKILLKAVDYLESSKT